MKKETNAWIGKMVDCISDSNNIGWIETDITENRLKFNYLH